MSGGFFRGTSADQDTRFSNKQAKLLKSQKFAPELEHLVDMKKVKMDVIRPWIANRVTELLGFEDEVLINFIYGLLDAKEVNGKELQVSLTGFMEKNTGKFMKELWKLLLSAQKNESGVPQQFLDAKEEETRKKQAEMDRITNEIQRKKEESKEFERARLKKMDGGAEAKANVAALEPASKHLPKGLSGDPGDDKETDNRNGVQGGNRGSPSHSSRSFSNSRSYSSDKHKSRSLSRSPDAQRRGISPDRIYHSPKKRPVTPRRRYSSKGSPSPSRRITSYSRQRSRSSSRRRSPSPVRRRLRSPSPVRRRLRSPFRRKSPSPIHQRSPPPARRRRSPSPVRRRRSPYPIRYRRSPSPVWRHRSPSLVRRRRSPSLVRHRRSRSPLRRRRSPSPMRRRSPSPLRRKSPSSLRRKSLSPIRHTYERSPSTSLQESPSPRHGSPIPAHRRSQVASPRRSLSPYGSNSPSPVRHRIHSSARRSSKEHRMPPAESLEERVSMQEKSFSAPRRPSSSLRSPHIDGKYLSPSPRRSPVRPESPLASSRSSSEDRRSISPYESPVGQRRGQRKRSSSSSGSPVRQRREHITHDDSLNPPTKPKEQKPYHRTLESSKEDKDTNYARDYKARSSQKQSVDSSITNKQNDSPVKVQSKDKHFSERVVGCQADESQSVLDIVESRKRDQEIKSEKGNRKRADPESPEGHTSLISYKDLIMEERRPMSYVGGQKSDEKGRSRSNDVKDNDKHHKSEISQMLVEKADESNGGGAFDSGSEESDRRRTKSKEKRRHKRSHKEVASDNDDRYDSEIEKKEAKKRRRKEEKKQRKEEKRRRHEERRRRREERRAERQKVKDPNNTSSSDDGHSGRRESHPSDGEDTQSEQKKLEIELRKKALESLKAKKGFSY